MAAVAAVAPEEALQRLRQDLPHYTSAVLKIRTKDAQLLPLALNRAQRIVHRKITAQRRKDGRVRAIVLKARQEGVSTYVAARYFRRIQLFPHMECLVIADERKRGSALFRIYERFDRFLPDELRPMRRYQTKGNSLVYDNPDTAGPKGLGSSIAVETAKDAEAGRASTIQMLHVSEIAFWEKPEDVWISLLQAVPDDDSEIIIESTANGVGNFFHGLWEEAASGESGFIAIFLPWWIHEEYTTVPSVDEANDIAKTVDPFERKAQDEGLELDGKVYKLTFGQLAWRRRAIAERFRGDVRKFRQEFPSTAEEAFLVAGNCFFDEDRLSLYRNSSVAPLYRASLFEDKRAGIGLARQERGPLRVWEPPAPKTKGPDGKEEHHLCVIFADTASGKQVTSRDVDDERGGRDFSCADVYCVTHRRYVAQYHARVAPEVFAYDLKRMGYLWSSDMAGGFARPALIGVERNHSSGETVLRILHDELRYPALYTHRMMNRRTNRLTRVIGWMTTGETRMPMLDELARAIREDSIYYPNADGIREMFTFVRDPSTGKPQAQDGAHDDRVIAAAGCLAIAHYARAHVAGDVPELAIADTPTGIA